MRATHQKQALLKRKNIMITLKEKAIQAHATFKKVQEEFHIEFALLSMTKQMEEFGTNNPHYAWDKFNN